MNRLLSASRGLNGPRLVPPSCFTAFRPHPNTFLRPRPVARRTTATVGLNKSGYINTQPGEGLLFFDNVFPLKTAIWDLRYLIMRYDRSSIESRVRKQCIPRNLLSGDPSFKITEIIPRMKDGGAFVKFLAQNPAEIEDIVATYLKKRRLKPWFSPLTRVHTYLVRGKPWLEDLHRFPSTRLRVEFISEDGRTVSQEALYSLFRRYGKISDIIPQDAASKDLPKYAFVQFLRMRSATAARNCLHGFVVPELEAVAGKEGGIALRIAYERTLKAHWLRDWIFKHPRIVLPAIAVILTTITVAIFDPIRTFFIRAKITHSLHFAENFYWNWFKDHTIGRLPFGKEQEMDDLSALWDERRGSIDQIKSWLLETEETFIVIQGPRGAGKRELVVGSVLEERKNVLLIDCETIGEAHGDAQTIAAAANQVGYRPVFSWLNSITSLLDLASTGAFGASAGLSQTLETQFTKILQNTGTALKQVALESKGDSEKDKNMSPEEWLAAHPEKRPVVVIDNFLHMDANAVIYERLADWAALLVESNTAHVIFLTNDISFSKALARALPDRVFRTVFLGDAQPESAKRYVLQHIDDDDAVARDEKILAELDESIAALGGRLTDLEFLARRIKTGETPKKAVHEIIETSACEILKLYFLDTTSERKWTPEQAWFLVRELAQNEQLRYNEVVIHDLFKGDIGVQSLEQAEMVSIIHKNGRPWGIKPGKPVYLAAFKRLMEDRVFRAKMELQMRKTMIKQLEAEIKVGEEELGMLNGLDKKPKARMSYLLDKVTEKQWKVEDMEKEISKLKEVLKKEY